MRNLRICAFPIICILFLLFACGHTRHLFRSGELAYLGGMTADQINPVTMLWWLIIFTPVWWLTGAFIHQHLTSCDLCLFRYSSVFIWWSHMIHRVMIIQVLHFCCFYLLLRLYHIKSLLILTSLVILWLHSICFSFIMSIMAWFNCQVQIAVIALILLECSGPILMLTGLSPKYIPMVWGMYRLSSAQTGRKGFGIWESLVLTVLLLIMNLLLPKVGKRPAHNR